LLLILYFVWFGYYFQKSIHCIIEYQIVSYRIIAYQFLQFETINSLNKKLVTKLTTRKELLRAAKTIVRAVCYFLTV